MLSPSRPDPLDLSAVADVVAPPSDRAARIVAVAGGRVPRVVVEQRLRRPGDPLAGVQAVGLALLRGVLEADDADLILAEPTPVAR